MEQNQHQKELHDIIVRARQVFPDENIFYDIGGKQGLCGYQKVSVFG